MRTFVLQALLSAGLVVAMSYPAVAVVNCDQVRRYLSTGRSVEDVADTMILGVDEVKKCQQAPGSEKPTDKKPEKPPAKPTNQK